MISALLVKILILLMKAWSLIIPEYISDPKFLESIKVSLNMALMFNKYFPIGLLLQMILWILAVETIIIVVRMINASINIVRGGGSKLI